MKSVEFVFQIADGTVKQFNFPWQEGMLVADVLRLSDCYHLFSELQGQKIGVFGKFVLESSPIFPGDRVEIYSPLRLDPKEARRHRVKKKK
jgi:putative ubiquitin-RnfH superfamily antitoxin RatB of RatAB toxin-antitoxin module